MIRAFLHIAHHTARECVRQANFIVALLTSLFIIGVHPVIALFAFNDHHKLVTDGCLATIMVLGWVVAVLNAADTVSREIEGGTAQLILSKPVSPAVFLFAKIIGVLSVSLLFVWVSGAATMLTVRVARDQFDLDKGILLIYTVAVGVSCLVGTISNYFRRTSFASVTSFALFVFLTGTAVFVYCFPPYRSAIQSEPYSGYSLNLLSAILLVLFSVFAMAAIATALSVQFNMISNLTICTVVFLLGLISDYLYFTIINFPHKDIYKYDGNRVAPLVIILIVASIIIWRSRCRANRSGAKRLTPNVKGLSVLLVLGAAVTYYYLQANTVTRGLDTPTSLIYQTLDPLKPLVAEILRCLLPNWQLYWMADALVNKRMIPGTYLFYASGYTMCYILLSFLIGFVLFQKQEVGKLSPA